MDENTAETIAIRALEWLVGHDELRPVFLGASGADEASLKAATEDRELLLAILEFLTMDDRWITEFCDWAGLDYSVPMAARSALPGGAGPHWT